MKKYTTIITFLAKKNADSLTVLLSLLYLSSTGVLAQTTYTTSQTVVAPSSGSVIIECWGGGGGGGGSSNGSGDATGGGGGGGAYSKQTLPITAGDNLVLTIGAGGLASNNSGGNGGTGGTTSIAAPFFTSATGGTGGIGSTCCSGAGGVGGSAGTGFLYRGGNGAAGTIAATNRGGGSGGSAGTGSNGNNAPVGGAGATAVVGGVAGVAGANGGCCGGASGTAGLLYGGGGSGATSYTTCCNIGRAGGQGKIILTFNACAIPTASTISGATNPCIGTSQVYTTGTTGATTYGWIFPTGWVVTSGSNTASITVTVGVGTGNITMSPSNGCGSNATQTLAGVTTCTAAAPQTIIYSSPGTYNWTVPATASCASVLLTVQAWGAGGGGGGAASNQNQGGDEACSEGGGGGGGGYTTRTYTVTSGQTYTIVVGAGGTAGPGSSASAATCNGGAGGNSTFSGSATVGPGTLTAYGGAGGGGAWSRNTSNGFTSHIGSDGAGGSGGSGVNGTVTFTGGSGSSGAHSGSCYDISGAGGGGAGTSANGGNGSTVGGCTLRTGGTGGASDGGNGANGRKLSSYTASREYTTGLSGSTVGGGGGGAMIHLNSWPNTWTTAAGGVGANGKVILSASISTCVLPIELSSFTGKCEKNQTVIEWITSTEINNDFFTVEQSIDGVDFTEATKIQGAGNSNVNNYYKTELESSEENTYFRLKQTDYDGQFSYSEPIHIKCSENITSTGIYPNPATNEIFVKYNLKNDVAGYIVNVLGEHVKNFNNNTDSDIINISIENLPVGMYNVVMFSERTGEFLSSTKFIKR